MRFRPEGAGPTYVSLHPSGKFLLVANCGGSVAVLPVLADGKLGPATDVKNDAGKIGPTKAVHAPPGSFAISGHDRTHAHMIQSDPSGKYVLHVDLGLDLIYVWKFDVEKGTLTANEPGTVALAGGGMGHGIFIFIRTESGCTPCRRKARRWCCLITMRCMGG
ncbi:MAG: beta-propeller fold lactonase family protein [Planctomycetales bacterium]